MTVRIAIAQCAPALGAFKRNVAMHLDWIGRARSGGAALVVFPELSLTGYYLKDLAADVACAADDARLAPIADASRDIDVCAGFVERAPDARLHIAQGYWSKGRLVHVHRKVYLPTYGIFDDGRYFGPGERFDVFPRIAGPTG
ncbi:MAG: nitrilase-related carbon-nitrogen hydrolase, partial [Chloroflexota bacterium]